MKRNWLLYLVIFSLALNFGTIATLVYLRYQDKAQRLSQEIPPPMAMRALWAPQRSFPVKYRKNTGSRVLADLYSREPRGGCHPLPYMIPK